MDKLEIMYLGKKAPVVIKPDYLPEPLEFLGHGHKAVIREDLGKRLMADNPKMFMLTGVVRDEKPLDDDEKEALFSDEGLEGTAEPEKKEKPLSQMNKAELADFAAEKHELVLDPENMTKQAMRDAIADAE
jgi:hypothetical protein